MTDSLNELSKLTDAMNAEMNEYGVSKDIVKTVDEKLGQATEMIREAQETLATSKADAVVAGQAAQAKTDADDATIVQLRSELKAAQDANG